MAQILLPTDGSETSFKAATFAFDLFGIEDVKYTLVHTYLKPVYRNKHVPGFDLDVERDAVRKLRRMERKARNYAEGITIAKKGSSFPLVEVLNTLVTEKKAGLIVMGTQGEGNYGLVGRNTSAVVLGAKVPVITVPSQWTNKPIKRIMLAIDGGKVEQATVDPLIALAKHTGAEIVLAHVRSNTVAFDERGDRAELSKLFGAVKHSFVTVLGDDITQELNDLAKQGKIQLVAVIHRKKSFWQRLFNASKAKQMALHTTTPLLVLPEQA